MVRFMVKKLENGFSTIEILIALLILVSAMSASVILIFGNQLSLIRAKIFQDLLSSSKIQIEEVRARSLDSFDDISSDENLEVALFYDYTKKIQSRFFTQADKNLRPVELPILISDWENSVGESTCFRRLPSVESYSIINEFNLSDSGATDIDVVRGKAYITLDSSSDPNFLIVDVSDFENPNLIGSIGTKHKLNALHIAGRYAFLATNSQSAQLQIVDVFDSLNSELKTEYRLPDPSSTTTAASIFYKNKKIYLGAEKHQIGQEFHIIDVSDTTAPQHFGAWEIGNKVNDIIIRDNFAFLASTNPNPLRIIDMNITDSDPIEIFISSPGNEEQAGQKLSMLDDFLILSRSVFSRNSDYKELIVFDIKSPQSPNVIDTFHFNETTRGIVARENFLAVATAWGNNQKVQFFQPNESYQLGKPDSVNISKKPTAIDCEDDTLYVVTESPAHLIIIKPL